MTDYRVIAIEIETSGGPNHPHVSAIHLGDGRRVPALRAMTNLKYGVEGYDAGSSHDDEAPLRTVGPCSACGRSYLRAEDPATGRDRLLRLPVRSSQPDQLRSVAVGLGDDRRLRYQ
jgi:hypothetical protein